MRFTSILWVLLALTVPSVVRAQYDFDDFLQAVESGQAKSTPSTPVPRLAQLPSGPAQPAPSTLQPLAMNPPNAIEFLPPSQGAPRAMNIEQLFEQQDRGLSEPVRVTSYGGQSCDRCSHARECTVIPYQAPNLPAPSSLRGYFNASPCIVNVWDGYACEASAACAKTRRALAGSNGHRGQSACGKTPCE